MPSVITMKTEGLKGCGLILPEAFFKLSQHHITSKNSNTIAVVVRDLLVAWCEIGATRLVLQSQIKCHIK